MASKVKHTYGSKKSSLTRCHASESSLSDISASSPLTRKRPLQEHLNTSSTNLQPPLKRVKTYFKPKTSTKENKQNHKKLTQLHFCVDQSVVRECLRCGLTYTKGAPDDENLHRVHCSRIQKGMEWGKEEEKEAARSTVQVASNVRLKDGKKGRIIYFKANVGGKIGSKLHSLLETINLTLSSPPISSESLRESKAYLFLISSPSAPSREKIVGCVIAQRISTAMAIVSSSNSKEASHNPTADTAGLVTVDATQGIFCHPTPLPTPLGISRLFVPSTHRQLGIARHLLSAAASTFIHGCSLDPRKGQVAFTQPTGDGNAVMMKWGEGGVRIYEE